MHTKPVLLALLVAATALAALPSADARVPITCVMAPCGPQEPVLDPCDYIVRQPVAGVWVYTFDDCSVRIDIKTYDCVWNCGWHTYVQGPPVTVRVYEQNNGETSAVTPPCQYCAPPRCASAEVGEGTLFAIIGPLIPLDMAYAGPHVFVRLNGDCTVDVWESRLDCQGDLVPLAHDETHQTINRVQVDADTCGVGFVCACMPPEVMATQQSIDLPPVCLPNQCCADPCPPPCDECSPPGPCPVRTVGTPYVLPMAPHPHATLRTSSNCAVDVEERDVPCPSNTEPSREERAVGPVTVDADTCRLALDCTCDPLPIAWMGKPTLQRSDLLGAATSPMSCTCDPIVIVIVIVTILQMVSDPCRLEAATPESVPMVGAVNPRATLWGNDAGCDVDVGENMWACAPPSGFVVERTVGFVHAKILVCDGGIGYGPVGQALDTILRSIST